MRVGWLECDDTTGRVYMEGVPLPAVRSRVNVEGGGVGPGFTCEFRLENGLYVELTADGQVGEDDPFFMSLFLRDDSIPGSPVWEVVLHDREAWIVNDPEDWQEPEAWFFPFYPSDVTAALSEWSGLTPVDKRDPDGNCCFLADPDAAPDV